MCRLSQMQNVDHVCNWYYENCGGAIQSSTFHPHLENQRKYFKMVEHD